MIFDHVYKDSDDAFHGQRGPGLVVRVTAAMSENWQLEKFPFDRQKIEVVVEDSNASVRLDAVELQVLRTLH
ncbi:MAG: hypothetical protein H7238_06600 [Polaromonas sp.]|nr:hypothetical protein [Polaromonas sp.]